jgi:iron-sulfur cluster assembly accessory protein
MAAPFALDRHSWVRAASEIFHARFLQGRFGHEHQPDGRTNASIASRVGPPYLPLMAIVTAPEIALTPAAAARVAAIAGKTGKPAILRLSVEGGGCSGFQYKFGLAEAIEADDSVAETGGARLVVDEVSLDLVRGCSVDFIDNLGGAHFIVQNPNAASGCGCGSSFSV